MLRAVLVSAVLVACGNGDKVHHLADAPPPPLDGEMGSEMPPPPATVTVTSGGAPAAGVTVYFQNPDSTLVREAMTDAAGTVSASVVVGSYVTVIEPAGPSLPPPGVITINNNLSTFAGVKPGDDLHLDLFPRSIAGTPITFSLIVPTDPNAATYTLYSSCGQQPLSAVGTLNVVGNNPPASVTLSGCNGMADMLVVTQDANAAISQWLYQPDVAVADAGTVTLTAAYQAPVATTFTYSNIPATSNGLSVGRDLFSPRGRLYGDSGSAPPNGTMAVASITMPTPAGATAVTSTLNFPLSGTSQQGIIDWGAQTTSYAVDYAAIALPDYATMPAFDAGTHAITWTESTGVAPDVVLGSYHGFRTDVTMAHSWTWRIVAPHLVGQPNVPYPTVPTTVYDFNPKTGDTSTLSRLSMAHVPGGYDAVRGHIYGGDVTGLVVGATGQIVYEDLYSVALHGLPHGRFTPHAR